MLLRIKYLSFKCSVIIGLGTHLHSIICWFSVQLHMEGLCTCRPPIHRALCVEAGKLISTHIREFLHNTLTYLQFLCCCGHCRSLSLRLLLSHGEEQVINSAMAQKALFKKGTYCTARMTQTDDHELVSSAWRGPLDFKLQDLFGIHS